ncbi:MAG TPA: bifunctional phosphoribosyl-AMP cyclohydrolase/phosphoribosyl-ATP diphosphatase HisIE [Candidatus Thermoplasmatota archaeon]|nr:bifunctional phosphoribosyl-AMP cyclohydrolase/phosphoribosyl-ATP diphosphatase HisIE [Candidatus Thermoplasmatota archaeon]
MTDPDFAKRGGLIPCVTQDAITGDVLTLAYMDAQALAKTRETGFVHFFSTSRNKLWKKGEESGHVQEVIALELDCDGDAILAKVRRHGPACHTGADSCFHERLHGEHDVTLVELLKTIDARKAAPNPNSHTAKLLASENLRLKKITEEGGELIMAAKDHDKERIAEEMADLLFHALVVMRAEDVAWRDVLEVLAKRRMPPQKAGAGGSPPPSSPP